ncbi:MAG: ABC transporter ATP-binding protein, partial [Flavobacteriaceae bacterium]|nr:ABC transporter ATP-binding protein [Flavobacteriaceae bacterium]
HLDVQHKMETFRLLQNLAVNLNKIILISTHEIQLALQMANKLWLMTKSDFITGNPKYLVKNDAINKLFDSNTIHFDKNSNQFKVI